MVKLVNSNLNNTFSLFSLVLKGERMMKSIHLASIEQKVSFLLAEGQKKKVHERTERVGEGEYKVQKRGKGRRKGGGEGRGEEGRGNTLLEKVFSCLNQQGICLRWLR